LPHCGAAGKSSGGKTPSSGAVLGEVVTVQKKGNPKTSERKITTAYSRPRELSQRKLLLMR
jgi:hypothetical protein